MSWWRPSGRGGSIPLHSLYFRGFCDGLTVCRFNDWQNSIGFHGAYMDLLCGGLYMRKLGRFPSVESVSFPDPLTATKSGAKVVYLCRRFYPPFRCPFVWVTSSKYVATKSESETNKNFVQFRGGFRRLAVGLVWSASRPIWCGFPFRVFPLVSSSVCLPLVSVVAVVGCRLRCMVSNVMYNGLLLPSVLALA